MDCVDPEKLAAINALKPGVHYRHGTRRPYRPCPPDFAEVYARLGWDRAINEHYRCNDAVIRRWLDESGGDELRAARSAVSGLRYQRRRTPLLTYAEAVAAILRGEDVPTLPPRQPRQPRQGRQRRHHDLHALALSRGYRLKGPRRREGAFCYEVVDRRDQPVHAIGEVAEVRAWLEKQAALRW